MFNLIAIPFGWIMHLIYQVVHSYGISILIFTIFIKLLSIPSTYKTQVNQARMGLVAPRLAKIKKSFPNNPQRVQEEQNKLYTQEGINPTSGCVGSLLMMILLLSVYNVVLRPLTHILQIGSEDISEAKSLLEKWLTEQNITEKYLNTRPELILLKYAKSNPDIFSPITGFADKLKGFENSFLGFDLAGSPSLHPENGWSFTNIMLILLPVFAALSQLALTLVTQAHNRKANPEAAAQMNSMSLMLYLSPLMTIWIGMSVPAGLSFYWFLNSVLTLVVTVLLYKYLCGERLEKINAREKEKQLKKGPGFMQRLMEQSAEYQAELDAKNGRSDANRTRYADGDDGMSRKERQEYERTLIEAARKRAALKYGDALPEDDSSNTEA